MKFKTDLRAVIFDFDGVINDSAGPGLERIIELATRAGHEIPADIKARLLKHWGTHGTKLLKTAFGLSDEVSAELYKEWERVDATEFFPLIAGAKGTLSALRQKLGLKIGMLTSRNRQNLLAVTDHHKITELFDDIQCKEDYLFTKPDPRTFDHILSLINARRNACVYVGDTIGDWQCAKNAGIRFVGVETGFLKRPDWLAAGLELKNVIRHIGWLPHWILKHW